MSFFYKNQMIPTGGGSSGGEVYSTEETRIGTWVDGKPLYRKAYVLNVLCPGGRETIILEQDLPAIDSLVKAYGSTAISATKSAYPSHLVSAYFGAGNKILLSNSNSSDNTATVKSCVIEYTKTTD